jgi:hypothetical protein
MENATSPAQTVIDKFGGHEEVAKIVGRHPISVRRWTYDREKGGTGGLIPSELQSLLLEKARKRGLDLTADDLIPAPAKRRRAA